MNPLVKIYFKAYPWLTKLPIRHRPDPRLALGFFDRKDFHALDELNAGRTGKVVVCEPQYARPCCPGKAKQLNPGFHPKVNC